MKTIITTILALFATLTALLHAEPSGRTGGTAATVTFDWNKAEVKEINGQWKVIAGATELLDYKDNKANAEKALAVIRHYRMNSKHTSSDGRYRMEYWLVNGQPPEGRMPGDDAIPFNPDKVTLEERNGKFTIVEGNHAMLYFEDRKAEAESALATIKKYRFDCTCYVGRPNAPMVYSIRSGGTARVGAPGEAGPKAAPAATVAFDWNKTEVKEINGQWKVVAGATELLDFKDNKANAEKALAVIRHYRMNSKHKSRDGRYGMEYWLVNGQPPEGRMPGDDALPFNPDKVTLIERDGKWFIVEASSMLYFEDRKAEAESALAAIKKYRFDCTCYVGRPQAPMTYFIRSGGTARVGTPGVSSTKIAPAVTVDGQFSTISIAKIATNPLDHLQRKPARRVIYSGVPFEFADPPQVFTTQNRYQRNNPTVATLKVNVARPNRLGVLIMGASAGQPEHQGKDIGVIKLGFADGTEFEAKLKAGSILRPETWAYNDDNRPAPSGDDVIKVVNVISESQNRGRPATAYVDMLAIDLPPGKALTTLTGITISDTSVESVHAMEPGFSIAAITVGQAAAPAARAVAAAPLKPAPAVVPVPAKQPQVPGAAAAAAAPDDKEIALDPKWMPDRRAVTEQSMKATAFYARAALDGAEPGKEIVPKKILSGDGWDLDWLMPLQEAEKKLPPGTRMQAGGATLLKNGTWPQNSIYVKSGQGKFLMPGYQHEIPGYAVFLEIHLICDKKQRLIGVQFRADDRLSPGWDPLTMKGPLKVEKLNPYYDLMVLGANAVANRMVEYQIVRNRDNSDVVVPGMTCIHTDLVARAKEIGNFKRNVRWYLAAPYARKLVEIAEMYETGKTPSR